MYDKEHSLNYKESLTELGELRSLMDELKDTDKKCMKILQLKEPVKKLGTELALLQKRHYLQKIMEQSDVEAVSTYYNEKTKKLKAQIKALLKENRELIYRLSKR